MIGIVVVAVGFVLLWRCIIRSARRLGQTMEGDN